MPNNRQVLIASLPTGALAASDFEVSESPIPRPADGEVLCRTVALTIGAGQRAGLQGSASYAGAPQAGVVMGGTGVATVIESRAETVPEGSLVTAPTGWQEYSVQPARSVRVVDPATDPAAALGVLGTNGMTAFFGLLDIGQPQSGETVVVSAAAGSVGHVVGQIAKRHGCRAVGVAGSDDKCRLLTDELGFDVAVNHRDPEFRATFKDATSERIGVYFDNTGGPVLESALSRMAVGGRIVCCGVVSQYDTSSPGPGPRGVPGLPGEQPRDDAGFPDLRLRRPLRRGPAGAGGHGGRRLASAQDHRVSWTGSGATSVRRAPRRPHRRHHDRHRLIDRDREVLASSYLGSRALDEADGGHP